MRDQTTSNREAELPAPPRIGSGRWLGAVNRITNMKLLNDIRDALRTVKDIRTSQVRELELKDAERHKTLLEENAKLKSEVKRAWLAYTKTHASIAKNVTDAGQFRAVITDSVADTESPNADSSQPASTI